MKKDITESAAFKQLVASRWKVALTLTVLMVSLYFGFLILVAYNKELLACTLTDGLTLAIVIGLFLLVFTWMLTGVYVWWANNKYDNQVEDLKKTLK